MSERLIEIRTELAASPRTRVELGEDGVLHVLVGPVTVHLERAVCEELTTTLARAMLALARAQASRRPARGLRIVRQTPSEPLGTAGVSPDVRTPSAPASTHERGE